MINILKPTATAGHSETKGEILDRISREYGKPEEKQRDPVKKLGKDEFFKLMVNQIQHQDPLKPYQNEEMAAQLAQFSALEQMMNVNSNLEKLSQAQQPLQYLNATQLIGKHVTVDSSRVIHNEGKYTDLHFDLPTDASNVRVMLLSEKGEPIREIEAKNLKQGSNKIAWDGKGGNSLPAKSGTYLVRISAEGEQGHSVPVQTLKTEMVHGIALEGKDMVLLAGDAKNPKKVFFKDVSKVVEPTFLQNPKEIEEDNEEMQSRDVEDYNPNLGKFTAINLPALRAVGEQNRMMKEARQMQQKTETDEMAGANPVAAAMIEGMYPPATSLPAGLPSAGQPSAGPALSAVEKALPSSADGSTAGKWTE